MGRLTAIDFSANESIVCPVSKSPARKARVMTVLRIQSVDVKVSTGEHGVLHVPSSTLGDMIADVTGDVNYERRMLAAILSEAIGESYFGCDILTLCAVAVNVHWTAEMISKSMADHSEEFIYETWDLFHD